MLPVDSSCTHAIATTPAGPVESCRSCRSTSGGLPCRSGRSAPALRVSRSARRSLTLWPACLLTPQRSLFRECFSPIRYLLEPLQVLPVGATSYRAGFAPARIDMPFTAHGPVRAMAISRIAWRRADVRNGVAAGAGRTPRQNVAFCRRRLYAEWGQPGFPSRFPAAGSMPRPEEVGGDVSKTHSHEEYLAL